MWVSADKQAVCRGMLSALFREAPKKGWCLQGSRMLRVAVNIFACASWGLHAVHQPPWVP